MLPIYLLLFSKFELCVLLLSYAMLYLFNIFLWCKTIGCLAYWLVGLLKVKVNEDWFSFAFIYLWFSILYLNLYHYYKIITKCENNKISVKKEISIWLLWAFRLMSYLISPKLFTISYVFLMVLILFACFQFWFILL